MKGLKFFFFVSFSLFSMLLNAQQAKIEVTNDPCASCRASSNGVQCGRCGSAMSIDRENVVTNPITKKTTYSYALKCPKDNHSMSCNSNVKLSSSPNASNEKVYCPVCKKEFTKLVNLISLHVWKKCIGCDGRGSYPDGGVCGYCKEYREIGKSGKMPEMIFNCAWRCYDCKPYRTFSLGLKEIKTRTFKGIEWVE